MDNLPLVMIFCQVHIVYSPCCNQLGACCLVEDFKYDDLLWSIWGKLAVLVIGFRMFHEFPKRHRALCGSLTIYEKTTLGQLGVNASLYLCGVCFVDSLHIIE